MLSILHILLYNNDARWHPGLKVPIDTFRGIVFLDKLVLYDQIVFLCAPPQSIFGSQKPSLNALQQAFPHERRESVEQCQLISLVFFYHGRCSMRRVQPFGWSIFNDVASCIEEIDRCMSSNRLKLNSEKTQFIWLGSRQQLSKVGVNQVHLGNHAVTSQSTVCNLGIHLDGQLTMKDGACAAYLPDIILPAPAAPVRASLALR